MLIVWFFAYKKLAQFAVRGALPPRRSESPVCATDNKPSCVLHVLGWFIGSRGFSSLERRPEFWVLHSNYYLGPLNQRPSILGLGKYVASTIYGQCPITAGSSYRMRETPPFPLAAIFSWKKRGEWESTPRQVDKKSGVSMEEKGVWNSQGGGNDKRFLFSLVLVT